MLSVGASAQTVYLNTFTGTGPAIAGGTPAAGFTNFLSGTRMGIQMGGNCPFTTFASFPAATPYDANTLVGWVAGPTSPGGNNGYVYTSAPTAGYAAPFNTTLSSNPGVVTWTFNMYTSANASGFTGSDHNSVVVLGATNANIATAGNGYAVCFNPTTPRQIQLIRYTGGIQGTRTNIIASAALLPNGTRYASVRVTYDPSTNTWSLYVRDDATGPFGDPSAGVTALGGTAVDATYTGTPLTAFGFYANHRGPSISVTFIFTWTEVYEEHSYFDNYRVAITGCALPAIGGTLTVCEGGGTTTLTNTTTGGTWSSTSPNVSIATPSSGVVTGVTPGTATVTYTVGTCTVGATVTVNPRPSNISGVMAVCTGASNPLTSAPAGGTWSSNAPGTASVDASGNLSGVAPGTATITYTLPTGCYSTAVATVTATPTAIGGSLFACVGATTTLTSTPAGGTWSSVSTGVGTISASGVVTGITTGTTTISYDMGSGCYRTATVSINPNPTPITGQFTICLGSSVTLNSTPAGGFWTGSSGTGSVSVGPLTGVVTGSGVGTANVTYTAGGCFTVQTVTVVPTPAPIVGPSSICLGFPSTTFTNISVGGTWGSSAGTGSISIVPGTGVATGTATGTATISYSLSATCHSTTTVTVLAPAPAPTGTMTVCVGATTTLNHTTGGGTWSCACPGIATVALGTGVVSGVGNGTCIVTYTLPTGCIATAVVTVHPTPPGITGITSVCEGYTTALGNAMPLGTWSSTPTSVATVGSSSGIVTGGTAGTATVSYIMGTGCYNTTTVTVNVTPLITAPTFTVCVGSTITMNATPAPGAWNITPTTVATIGGSGIVTALAPGTAMVSYVAPSGCFDTAIVTVLDTPSHISGSLALCVAGSTTLTATPVGGTWLSATPTVASTPPVVNGLAAGTSNITYTIPNGCRSTATVTVHALPGTIGGTLTTCVGQCTALSNSSGGGAWSSSNTAVGTIDPASGLFCGLTAGTSTIVYSLGTGCSTSTVVTVNPLPLLPSVVGGGPATVCEGSTITLSSSALPGTWSSSFPSIGTVNTVGVVGGVSAGTTSISYTLTSTGCSNALVVTVNALPAAITGATAVCVGQCTTLTSAPGTGSWSSSNASVGSIGSASGSFCGVSSGTATTSYILPTGCYRTTVMLVNPLPTSISPAAPEVCEQSTLTLTGNPTGGTWTSTLPANGTIGTGSGILGGIAAGTTTIIYTLPTTCTLAIAATVNPLPSAIAGTFTVCVGATTTLTSTPGTGTWSSPSGNVTVVPGTGEVTGVTAGTALISYTLPTGCAMTAVMTVMPLPSAISGTAEVCIGLTTTLNSTPAGTWSSFNTAVATAAAGGLVMGVSADTTTIMYTLATGCRRGVVVTVHALPTPITGAATTCVSFSTTLNSTPAGGTWTSSLPSVGSISAPGVVTGVSGPLTTVISYTLPTGCRATQVVTVYSLPANITGVMEVCQGLTTSLFSIGTGGGTWSSSNPAIASVGSSSGVVTGVDGTVLPASTATITYTLGSGCYKTTTVTVHPLPADIAGTMQVCATYGTTLLTNSTGGGTWSSSNTAIGTVSTGGLVGGVAAGTTNITYRLTTTGCYKVATVTVNTLPAHHTGTHEVCVNETITLNNTPPGGTWNTPSGNVAVGASSGVVTGVAAGSAVISYAAPVTGCVITDTITVNPLPANIGGILEVCVGGTTALTNTTGGGSWSSSAPLVGSISSLGVVSGISAGTTNISYTLLSTGCRITATATVHPLPVPIIGPDAFCNFTTATYTSTPGGHWYSADPTILAFADSAIGNADGLIDDTTIITYRLPTGCSVSKQVFLILAPYPITGPDDVCVGSVITMANAIGGGGWSSSDNSKATVAPVTSSTADVTGHSAGFPDITYTLSTGCFSVKPITVNPLPAGILGNLQVCEGLTTSLTNATPGGTWSSSDVLVADVGTTGIVTGIDGGLSDSTAVITYALGTGCNAKVTVTVHPLPAVITGTPEVCEGLTTTLFSGPAGGIWTSTDLAVATIGSGTGIVTGVSGTMPGVGGIGQTIITYTLPTSCIRTQNFTVNPLPADITGISNLCVGDMTILGSATPGVTWISSDPTIATVDPIGVVTGVSAGSVIITTMLSTGCIKTWPMTINGNPATIGGSLTVCAGFATNLTSSPAGGVWSSDPASNPYGTINAVTGVVSAITGGLVPVTYTMGSGCRTTAVVTVINLPPAIGGLPRVCEAGGTTTLTHSMSGGVWSVSNPAIASVDAAGIVTGHVAGTTVVTFTVGTGCFNILTVTVNPLPAPITGTDSVCVHSSVTLMSATPGGVWASDSTHRAYVVDVAGTGVVTGVSAGLAQIRYTVVTGGVGCYRTKIVRVDPTPEPITGNQHICMGSAGYFTSISTGGVWSISNPAVATLAPTTTNTVIAVPVSLGSATITYEFPGHGCRVTRSVTVQPLPTVYNVTGGGSYCSGGTGVHIGLSGSQPGVSYVLYHGATAVGYVSGTGLPLDFGLLTSAGTYTVLATNITSGCTKDMAGSATVVIAPQETPSVSIVASPTDSICPGETVTLNPTPVHGGTAPTFQWKVNGVNVSTGLSYSFVPADGDVVTVVMTSNHTCLAVATATGNKTLTVLPMALPVAGLTVDPNDSVCQHAMVTFTAAPEYGGSAPAYAWRVNGIPVGTGPTYSFMPGDGNVVNYTLTSNYRCRLANSVVSSDVKMYVEPMVIPTVVIHADPGLSVMTGKPIALTAVAFNAGASPTFQWKVNGYPVPGATSDSYTAVFNDRDSIACEVISDGICSNIGTSDWVFVSITTSVRSQAGIQSDIRLMPNPNKGTFQVRGTLAGGATEDVVVDVTDMLGQVVYKGTLRAIQGRIDAQVMLTNALANGMYILTLHTQEGQASFHFVMEQ
ncbi:hypothetical protein GCM10023093_12640 [Nemorincola caseinilytica]|uniref:BIG2 domain-containing protein n=1 Tax=Nemorincola caseinilytica TaxID=2054315 RepID=A0ABP8NDW2_9BACT